MQIITIAIQKGGAAKTTTAATLAQAAEANGLSVLAVDMDSQANLSYALAANNDQCDALALLEGAPVRDLIQTTPQHVDVIASNMMLATVSSGRGSARRLAAALAPIRDDYDIIIIDTPNTPGELVYNALQAATGVIIPCNADAYNMQSIYQTSMLINQFRESNRDLKHTGLLLTRYTTRSRDFAQQVREMIQRQAAEIGAEYLGEVREGSAITKAAFVRRSLYKYDKRSNPARDYMRVLETIIEEG